MADLKIGNFITSRYQGIETRPYYFRERDRDHGLYVVGKTGTGKSTFLENLIAQDAATDSGFCVIEPHRVLIERVLNHIPRERIPDVHLVDFADYDYPVPFNPLAGFSDPRYRDERHRVVSNLIGSFKQIWSDDWSVTRMERILRYTLHALIEYPHVSLLSIQRFLTEPRYRDTVLSYVTDPIVLHYWQTQFPSRHAKQLEYTESILNRIDQLFTAQPLRNILGTPANAFDLTALMDKGGILLINLASGQLGEDNANFLGSLYLAKIYYAAMARDPNATPLPFTCYVDEFTSYNPASFADKLSQARKFKLRYVLAHQYLDQMTHDVRASVFGNVGSMVAFRVGYPDQKRLQEELAEIESTEIPLVDLDNYHMHIKLLQDGSPKYLQATADPPPDPQHNHADEIIRQARDMHHSLAREEVESYIRDWYAGKLPEPIDGSIETA